MGDAAAAAQRRLQFVLEASEQLSASLDVDTVLANLARILVPGLSDWCSVDLREEDGSIRRLLVTHADPAKAETAAMLARFPPDPEGTSPIVAVLGSGESLLVPEIPEPELERAAVNAEHLAIMRALGYHSAMIVPLVARERCFGAVTLVAAEESTKVFDAGDLALVEALARRAALAVDNARLYEEVSGLVAEREASFALLDAIFTQTPVGLCVLDRDLRFVRINDVLAALHGLSPEAHIGRSIDDVLPSVPAAIESFRHVARTGDPLYGRETTVRLPGREDEGHYLASYFPVRAASGELLGVGVAVVDITERHRAEEERQHLLERERQARADAEAAQARLGFLAEASRMLAESLDIEETMHGVATLAVDHLADWVLIDVVDRLEIQRMVCRHRDPGRQSLVERMAEGPRDPNASHPVGEVLTSRRPVLIPDVEPAEIAAWARDEGQALVMEELGVRSLIVVPLEARGRTLGALVLVSSESDKRFDEQDLVLAGELAQRAALAADNARLYRDRTRVARTLQRSLLPPALPEIPTIEVHASFHAAAEDVEVGGDFFDVFQVGDDEWAVLIGDVCGTGPEAATVTALARHTLRAAAMRARRPARVLAVLNEVLQRHREEGDDRFCTVAYGRLRPGGDGARLTLACGGHPMPLLVSRVGRVIEVGRPGMMLGIVDDPHVAETTTDLTRGDAVVFFTDGVIEARGEEGLYGEARLRSLLVACTGMSAQAIVESVVSAVVAYQEGELRDDVAVLVIRVTG